MKVFLWSGDNFVAESIQYFTESRWSHCGFVWDSGRIVDSDWGILNAGVQVRDNVYSRNSKRYREVDLNLSLEQERILRKVISENYVAKFNYDYTLILSFVLEWFQGDEFFRGMKHKRSAFTCSEFVAHALERSLGISVVPGRKPHTVRPADVALFLDRCTTGNV